jgi:hypothetical protein
VLHSIECQTIPPNAVAVVCRVESQALWAKELRHGGELVIKHAPPLVGTQAWNEGFALLASANPADFWLFLDEYDFLEPNCLERMAALFCTRPDVGIVTPWTDRTGAVSAFDARPSPALRYQLTGNDIAPASGFRARALGNELPFKPGLPREHDVWALSNSVIANGWTAVTFPALLARRDDPTPAMSWAKATSLRAIRAEALEPFDTAANRLALQLVDAYVPLVHRPIEPGPTGQRLRRLFLSYLEAVLLRPKHVLRYVLSVAPGLPSRGAIKQ